MKKIYLLLIGLLSFWLPALAQVSAPLDSIAQALDQQLGPIPATPLQRAIMVRQQLQDAVLDEQLTRIPLLLEYLARAVPESVPTVQPREALSLLLAAGAFGPLLKRVIADKAALAQRRYRQALLLPPSALGDVADFYLSTHTEALKAQSQSLTTEEAAFITLLLEVLPRGGVSPALDAEIDSFQQQFPHSEYGYLLRDFHNAEQNKISLRALQEEEEKQNQLARQAEWGASELARRENTKKWRVAYDAWELKSGHPSRFCYGLDFYSGTGFFTNGLNAAFRPRYNLGNGFEFGWDHFMLYLRNYIGWAEARTDFSYDGHVWPAGQTLNYYIPEVSGGFRLVDRPHFMLTPFAGFSWFYFAPSSSDSKANPALKMDVFMRYPFTAGINLDIPVIKTRNGSELGYWILKVRSGVRAAEAPLRPALHGTLFYLDIGIGGFGRMLRSNEASPRR